MVGGHDGNKANGNRRPVRRSLSQTPIITLEPSLINFYEVLSIERTSSVQEIKAAYHRALLQHHPDKVRTAPSKIKMDMATIKMAYITLSSPKDRHEYDMKLMGKDRNPSGTPRPAQFLSLEEFEEDGGIWRYTCRCGGTYRISEEDMERELHLSGCDGCSEVVWVGFEVVEE